MHHLMVRGDHVGDGEQATRLQRGHDGARCQVRLAGASGVTAQPVARLPTHTGTVGTYAHTRTPAPARTGNCPWTAAPTRFRSAAYQRASLFARGWGEREGGGAVLGMGRSTHRGCLRVKHGPQASGCARLHHGGPTRSHAVRAVLVTSWAGRPRRGHGHHAVGISKGGQGGDRGSQQQGRQHPVATVFRVAVKLHELGRCTHTHTHAHTHTHTHTHTCKNRARECSGRGERVKWRAWRPQRREHSWGTSALGQTCTRHGRTHPHVCTQGGQRSRTPSHQR